MDELNKLSGRRVLITGAAGFLGTHVAARATRAGAVVIETSSRSLPGFATLDVGDFNAVSALFTSVRPDVVIHLAAAAVSGQIPFADLLRVNCVGVNHVLDACAALLVPPAVVLAGSGFEYGSQARPVCEDDPVAPFSPYGVSKAAGAHSAALFADRLPIVLLRLFNVYGPGEAPRRLLPHIVRSAREGCPVETTQGEQLRDFVFAPDAAEAFLRCALLPRRPALAVLNLGSGSPVRLRDFIELAASELRASGFSPELRFGAIPYRPGEPMSYQADVSRLATALDWIPPTSLADGMRLTVESLLQQPT